MALAAVYSAIWRQLKIAAFDKAEVRARSALLGFVYGGRAAVGAKRSAQIVIAGHALRITELPVVAIALVFTEVALAPFFVTDIAERAVTTGIALADTFEKSRIADFTQGTLSIGCALAQIETVSCCRVAKHVCRAVQVGVTGHTTSAAAVGRTELVWFTDFVAGAQTLSRALITTESRRAILVASAKRTDIFLGFAAR